MAVLLQERAGLDYVSDGEWRRESYTRVMSEAVDGFQNDLIPVGDPAPPDMAYPAVVSRLRRDALSPRARSRSCAADRLEDHSRAAVALHRRLAHVERGALASAYATREEFMAACTEVIREEVRELSEHGRGRGPDRRPRHGDAGRRVVPGAHGHHRHRPGDRAVAAVRQRRGCGRGRHLRQRPLLPLALRQAAHDHRPLRPDHGGAGRHERRPVRDGVRDARRGRDRLAAAVSRRTRRWGWAS